MGITEYRVPVGVTLSVDREGNVTPTSIVWDGGKRVFPIVSVLGRPLRAQDPETDEIGWCYTVTIPRPPKGLECTERRLYRYGPRWYVYCRSRFATS